MTQINIHGKMIGHGHPTYTVAEIGFNHEGDMNLAVKMIEAAAKAGADAVKFQTYRASNLVLESVEHFNIIKHGELSLEDHQQLIEAARENHVTFFSTAYGKESVDILEEVDVPAYKVASMDLTNLPLLRYIAATGKPMIVSTGMATLGEIAEAVETIQKDGNDQIILLHCLSKYPAPPEEVNLKTISLLQETFDLPAGYSDHVLGNTAALAAVALGACMIEKHFTTDKTLPGPDHKMSADPQEFGQLVRDIRSIESSMGGRYDVLNRPDRGEARVIRRSIFAKVDIPAGAIITEDMIKCVRPEGGLLPKYWDCVVGRKAKMDIVKETPITWEGI
jgi:N-acetylneuraminate synthase/N,N'-diacetyllegionaminate synthase